MLKARKKVVKIPLEFEDFLENETKPEKIKKTQKTAKTYGIELRYNK